LTVENFLNYCPRCGKSNIDSQSHGSPGIGLCNDCGTLFSVMSVKVGKNVVPLVKSPLPLAEPPPKSRG
jgi:hypothetical protein